MSEAPIGWNVDFLLKSDADSLAGGMPAAGVEPVLAAAELVTRLRSAANDTFGDLLVIGWAREVLSWIAHDGVLKEKRITWLVRPEHLGALMTAIGAIRPQVLNIRIALVTDRAQLPQIFEHLPVCWSLAVLDDTLCPPGELHLLGQTKFTRTRGAFQRIWGDLRHLNARLGTLGDTIPLDSFKRRFAGRSALCIAAGPSLNQRLDFIRQHMHRCIVIVVDVVQAKLQAAGIKVDFVLNVDSHGSVTDLLATPADADTVLVMPVNGHRAIDAKFPRRSYFSAGGFAGMLLGDQASFATGTTVGIASVGFADYLGCDEVVLIGHDLSYSETVYYSEFVADHANHTQAMFEATRASRRMVPGNSGKPVVTDYLFEVAIQDMALLLAASPALRVYNPNINDRIAASLLGTKPLPAEWSPVGSGDCPRPDAKPRLGERLAKLGDLRTALKNTLAEQLTAFHRVWKEGEVAGMTEAAIAMVAGQHPACYIAAGLIAPLFNGALLQLVRLRSLPPSIGTRHHHEAVLKQLHSLQHKAGTLFAQAFADPAASEPTWLDPRKSMTQQQKQFVTLVDRSLARPLESPADSVLMPVMCRSHHYALEAFPGHQLPEPQSAMEGLLIIKTIGGAAPPAFISQTLCLCALDSQDAPLEWARATAVVDQQTMMPQRLRTGGLRKLPAWIQATEAVLRLREPGCKEPGLDAERACRWTTCQVHLIRALLATPVTGVPILEHLLAHGRLVIDDQMAALIMLHVPDYQRACDLVRPHGKVFGEAFVLAMIQRHAEQRDFATAIRYALSVRPLSRFKDQSTAVMCECLLAQGDAPQLQEAIGMIVDPGLRQHWRHQLDQHVGGYRLVTARLEREPQALPDPAATGDLAAQAWAAKDAAAMQAIFAALCWKGLGVDQAGRQDQYKELFASVRTLLAHLGVDAQRIEERVKAQSQPVISGR